MSAAEVEPDIDTFNAVLGVLARCNRYNRVSTWSRLVLNEMHQCHIGTYFLHLFSIFTRKLLGLKTFSMQVELTPFIEKFNIIRFLRTKRYSKLKMLEVIDIL
jgi:hypothetical protein